MNIKVYSLKKICISSLDSFQQRLSSIYLKELFVVTFLINFFELFKDNLAFLFLFKYPFTAFLIERKLFGISFAELVLSLEFKKSNTYAE